MSANSPAVPVGASRPRFTSIAGFSDQNSMPRVAKLRLGIVVAEAGKKDHPRETDHFVLDVEDSIPPKIAEEIRERFAERYGANPQIVDNVVFISPRRDDVLSTDYEVWKAGKLFCHGDGDKAQRKINGEWVAWLPCANGGCPDFNRKEFTTRLRFMLPDVTPMGYFQIDTGSIYGTANMRDALTLVETMTAALFGAPQIHNIPFVLSRVAEKVEFEGKLNTHYIIHLYPENLSVEALRTRLNRRLAAAGEPVPESRQVAAPMDIIEAEQDMPDELVPAGERQEPEQFDPNLEDEFTAAAEALKWNVGTVTAKRAQFPKQADLVADARRELDARIDQAFESLKIPKRDETALREKFTTRTSLLAELRARWDAQPKKNNGASA